MVLVVPAFVCMSVVSCGYYAMQMPSKFPITLSTLAKSKQKTMIC